MGVEGIPNLSAFRRLIQFCHRAGDINQYLPPPGGGGGWWLVRDRRADGRVGRVGRAFELHEGLRGLGLRADMDTYISLLALAHRHSSPPPPKKWRLKMEGSSSAGGGVLTGAATTSG
jgi:hypothetical protein